MLRSRFLWKLYAGYAFLILLSTTVVGVLIALQVERNTMEQIRESLRVQVALLREPAGAWLRSPEDAATQERLQRLGRVIGARLTLIGADGAVIGDSQEDPSKMDNHANRPEILAARRDGIGTATRFSNTLETRMIYLALPVSEEGQLAGFVRASLSLSAVGERLSRLRAIVALAAGLSALVALLLGFLLARSYSQPLVSMTAVAESVAAGDYDKRLPDKRSDEIGKLAQAINRMAEKSRNRMQTIDKERNKLLAILAGMVEGVVAVDGSDRIVHMNLAAGEILGADPDAALGLPIWEVTRVSEVCQAVSGLESGVAEVKKQVRLPGHPSDRVVEIHAAPLPGSPEQPAGAVVVLHDVSELHRLETVRRDFVSNVSHELKTPITAIRGLVETLIDDRKMPQQTHQRFLGKIHDQTMRLSSIVTDLLTLSRLESEESLPELQPLDLRDTVRGASKSLLPIAADRGIEVEVDLPSEAVRVLGDREAIRQATGNLLDNALKYTPSGGRVWLRLRGGDGEALIEVRDTGIGIEPSRQQRIFERFYRVDKARSRELGGTGLGLSIVKHIALTHGGRVSLESKPGQGSTFRIHLPLGEGDFTLRRRAAERGGEKG